MTTISTKTIQQLATLSALDLSADETNSLQQDIERILGYVEKLAELDTSNVEPTYQVTGLSNVWRDDSVEHSEVGRDALLALAPSTDKSQIKVPKVL